MKCEFDYCLYNKEYECILRTTQINIQGMCGECIMIKLDKKFLEEEKERQLKEIEARWADTLETKKIIL